MELRHLRYFVAVAETGSLSQAALKLFVAQPPLSVQIRQLENQLGEALFVRHPKGIRLTAAGRALLPEARFLLDRAERLQDVVSTTGVTDNLSIGFVPSASSTILPDLLRQLKRHLPKLNLELREMISTEQLEALVAGHIDLGITRTPTPHPRLIVSHQMPDPFCLALAQDDAAELNGAIDLRCFSQHSFVGFTRHRGPAYFDQSIHLCSKAGFSPRIRYEASTVYGVLELVSAGVGVALVPASSALLPIAGVALRPLRRTGAVESLALLRRKTDNDPILPFVEASVADIFKSLQQRLPLLLGSP